MADTATTVTATPTTEASLGTESKSSPEDLAADAAPCVTSASVSEDVDASARTGADDVIDFRMEPPYTGATRQRAMDFVTQLIDDPQVNPCSGFASQSEFFAYVIRNL